MRAYVALFVGSALFCNVPRGARSDAVDPCRCVCLFIVAVLMSTTHRQSRLRGHWTGSSSSGVEQHPRNMIFWMLYPIIPYSRNYRTYRYLCPPKHTLSPVTFFFVLFCHARWVYVPFRTKLLRRKFAERFSSPDGRSDINYVAFLAAVDLAMAGHDKVTQTHTLDRSPIATETISSSQGRHTSDVYQVPGMICLMLPGGSREI